MIGSFVAAFGICLDIAAVARLSARGASASDETSYRGRAL
jgi:hypothetical protein